MKQRSEEDMIRRLFWSLFVVVLACSSGSTAEIRRIVTGIDQSNKAVVLFDRSLTLKPGGSGNPAANLWITDSLPPGFSFTADTVTRPLGLNPPDNGTVIRVVEFPPLDPAKKRRWPPIS
jgi:hypothetical protein